MSRPKGLDLFCSAGGSTMGYHRAGFEMTGVDIDPQPNFPFEFVQADALEYVTEHAHEYAFVAASPPCQAYTGVPGRREDHPDLLPRTRELLQATGLPYAIENVPGAPMPDAILLCGATFGLPIVRHRLFEIYPKPGLVPSLCPQESWGRAVEHSGCYPYGHGAWRPAWREHVLPVVWPWMTLEEAGQAIPPAFTEWIGSQLLASFPVGSENPR